MDVEQEKLSHREDEILQLASEGLTDKEIANHLGVQLSTVRTYWDRLKNKLGAANRTEAVARSLRQSRGHERYTLALQVFAEAVPHHVVVTDSVGRIEYGNARWQEYFGFKESHSSDWDRFVHSEDLDQVLSLWKRVAKEGIEGTCLARCRRSDGAYRKHLLAISPLEKRDGSVLKWIRTAVDVHDLLS
jgi:PAS domain S-box-containing protein